VWPIFQKSALFTKKSVLFIQNSVEKSESARSDFFQPAEFLNTALNTYFPLLVGRNGENLV
jgi:hypothetical protein